MHRFVPLSLLALGLLSHPQAQRNGLSSAACPRGSVFITLPPSKANATAPPSASLCPTTLGQRSSRWFCVNCQSCHDGTGAGVHPLCIGGHAFRPRPEQGELAALLSIGARCADRLIPAVPGKRNIVFRRPILRRIYQWSTALIPQGESPIPCRPHPAPAHSVVTPFH